MEVPEKRVNFVAWLKIWWPLASTKLWASVINYLHTSVSMRVNCVVFGQLHVVNSGSLFCLLW